MAQWERTDRGIQFVTDERRPVEIGMRDWETSAGARAPSPPGQRAMSARVRSFTIPASRATIAGRGGTDVRRWAGKPTRLQPTSHEIRSRGAIGLRCRFEGPARIRPRGTDRATVAFDDRRGLTVTATVDDVEPSTSVTAPRSLPGLAAALTRINARMDPSHPDRSWPSLRPRPPALVLDDAAGRPEPPAFSHPLAVRVPHDVGHLFVVAPIAFYLGLPIKLSTDRQPSIHDRETEWRHRLPSGADLEATAARLLRRCLLLDSQVRSAGRAPAPAGADDLLARAGLSGEELYQAPLRERLQSYLEVSMDLIQDAAPEWPLVAYIQPTIDAAPALPYALDRLSILARPRSDTLSDHAFVERSLDACFRGGGDRIEFRDPFLHDARYHAWLGPGVPIGVYTGKAVTVARDYGRPDRREEGRDILVVINDDGMAAEVDTGLAANCGQDWEVTVRRNLDRTSLREVFQQPYRLIHFIGHCDDDGLRCPDGHLALDTVEPARAESFFLNACRSYRVGLALVEAGCRVGAVTYAPVIDRQAALVGEAFVGLLGTGFPFERALDLARRRIKMGNDYAVVGDGTYRLARRSERPPTVAHALPRPDGTVELSLDTTPISHPGSTLPIRLGRRPRHRLHGSVPTRRMSRESFARFLERRRDPVIYDGTFRRPEALLADL